MKKNLIRLAASLALPLSLADRAPALPGAARELQDDFSRAAASAKPAVVNISTIREEEVRAVAPNFFFSDPDEMLFGPRERTFKYRSGGMGTGFLIDAAGHVLTNEHVVRNAAKIQVTLTRADGSEETLPGRVVGRDPNLDLAVVQIQAKRSFPFLRLADSDKVRVGNWAIAIGSPFSLKQTVTAGIISALRQSISIEGRPYLNLLQTDAAINQGNSGGPLLDLDAEVIGVNTAIYSPSGAFAGVGFAIPSNEVRLALEYLLAGREAPKGWLGVEAAPVDDLMRRRFGLDEPAGVVVNSVVPGSPAEAAKLRRGDVIRRLNGAPIESPQDLSARICRMAPDSSAVLDVLRKGASLTLSARLGKRPDYAEPAAGRPAGRAQEEESPPEEEPAALSWEGAVFEPSREGVRVSRIEPSSALQGTLKPGDLIRGVDESEVSSIEELRRALAGASLRKGVLLDVLRRGRPMYLSIKG